MEVLLEVFRQNSISIYKVFGENDRPKLPNMFHSNSPHHTQKPSQDRKEFTDHLEAISKELRSFLKSLSDTPEFSDKKLTNSILAFEGWLIYRTVNLEDLQGEESQKGTLNLYLLNLLRRWPAGTCYGTLHK